jgi:Zn-dependent peptidase ImmA (M78 family)
MVVFILGKPFKIIWKALKWFQKEDEGLCYTNQQKIYIQKGLGREEEQDVILHEIIHAIDHSMHLDLDESQVSRLASGLIALFKDNPDFYKRCIK